MFVIGVALAMDDIRLSRLRGLVGPPIGRRARYTSTPQILKCADPTAALPVAATPSDRCHNSSSHSRWLARACASARNIARVPPFQALRDAVALPSSLRGPVDCFHGLQARILSACC